MNPPTIEGSPREIARVLREQLREIEGVDRVSDDIRISTGCAALDRLLPGEGFACGQLIEWLADTRGSGVATLAMIVARQACRDGGALIVADRTERFYPPAAAGWGIDLKKLIVIHARGEREELWALGQALRCPGVAAVWARLERLGQRSFRRLQLAAEAGRGLGLLLRPASVRGQPTWSDAQLLVQPRPSPKAMASTTGKRRLHVELLRCRGATGRGAVELEIDEVTGTIHEIGATRQARTSHETHSVHLAAQLARPTSGRRSARA